VLVASVFGVVEIGVAVGIMVVVVGIVVVVVGFLVASGHWGRSCGPLLGARHRGWY